MTSRLQLQIPVHDAPVYHTCHNSTVLLFGEVLADIFPDRTVLGGAPFNVARHLKAFGLNPVLISRMGNDPLRDKIMQVMSTNQMETLGMQCNKIHPTGQVSIQFKDGSHQFNILPDQAYDFIHPSVARMTTLTVNPSFVYFGTLAQRNQISERALKILVRSTSAPKFLDLNLRTPWYNAKVITQSLQFADILKLNDEELQIVSKMLGLGKMDATSQAEELLRRFDLDQVIVTRGAAGAWYIDRNGNQFESSSSLTLDKLEDTVGAGDGFAAVCLLGLMQRWPIGVMLNRANEFAARICQIRGAIPESPEFYQPFHRKWE